MKKIPALLLLLGLIPLFAAEKTLPVNKQMIARVPPQPGQGMPNRTLMLHSRKKVSPKYSATK